MIPFDQTVAAGLGTCGMTLLALGLRPWLLRRPRRFCPGPRALWRQRLMPLRLCRSRPCGYDLSACPVEARGEVTCPECGRHLRAMRQTLRTAAAWRPRRMSIALLALAAATPALLDIEWSQVIRALPTPPLLLAEGWLEEETPRQLYVEVRQRFWAQPMNQWETDRMIAILVRNLRDDSVHWNGGEAIRALQSLGELAVPALEGALDSDDWQQRHFAACILRGTPWYSPTGKLLDVTLQGMRGDSTPQTADDYLRMDWSGMRYLAANADAALAHIRAGMMSDDDRQQALCAIAAGLGRRLDLIEQAGPILVARLRSNQMSHDAGEASGALRALGPAALPYLQPFADSADRQQRTRVRKLLQELTRLPPATGVDANSPPPG